LRDAIEAPVDRSVDCRFCIAEILHDQFRLPAARHNTARGVSLSIHRLNVMLPAFAAEHRRLQHDGRSYRSISVTSRALSSKPAGRRCC